MPTKWKKCPLCGEKILKGKNNMVSHVTKEHIDEIPMGQTPGEYVYLAENGSPRKCMICKNPTEWNTANNRYNAFCSDKCKREYVKLAHNRVKKTYGKECLLGDPDFQKKMLANRKISGKYRFEDGGEVPYTGSYEEDFCKVLDHFLGFSSSDVIMPSPHVYKYNYDKKEHFYIPDAFLPSLLLEVEIKDGGANPNMHHKIQNVDKKKEQLKDDVMVKQKDFHYIKVEDKNYEAFFDLVEKLTNDELTENEKTKKIKVIPEHKELSS